MLQVTEQDGFMLNHCCDNLYVENHILLLCFYQFNEFDVWSNSADIKHCPDIWGQSAVILRVQNCDHDTAAPWTSGSAVCVYNMCVSMTVCACMCLCHVCVWVCVHETESFIQLRAGDLMSEIEIWNGSIISPPDKDWRARGQSQFTHSLLARTTLMKFGRLKKDKKKKKPDQYRYTKTTLGNKSWMVEFFSSAPGLSTLDSPFIPRGMEREKMRLREGKRERIDKAVPTERNEEEILEKVRTPPKEWGISE